mmetsp:Transcript_19635/g.18968  ORF Transcript_19635/g.18968 Transcript_19635/m.18968 type:complete len:84 (+) Transcript_19635:1331-1582(+)
MDSSIECSELTLGYWLVLSLSDIIVTQREPVADPTLGGASSAFSRYALIYGLKPDAWRNAKDCDQWTDTVQTAKKWHGNWFCT